MFVFYNFVGLLWRIVLLVTILFNISKKNTLPRRLAPMGPNVQTHIRTPWRTAWRLVCSGATFGRDGPVRRQLLLPYHPCLAYRSQPLGSSDGPENGRSARRPTWQQGGRISSSEDHVWRRYTPHKTSVKHSENGGRHGGTPSCRLELMGPNPCAHLHRDDPPSSLHRLPRQWVVALSSSKAGSLATLTYLKGYPTKIS